MSEDILAEWKTKKFIVADSSLVDQPGFMVILTDWRYWSNNFEELQSWCALNGGEVKGIEVKGMTVSFGTEQQLTLFALRWS